MNREDRINLVTMARQFVPVLFEQITDPGTLADEVVLALIGETMAYLDAQAQDGWATTPGNNPPLPGVDPAVLADVLRRERVQYYDNRVVETGQVGGRKKRHYEPVVRAAEIDDIIGMTLTPGGLLSFVVSDGKSYEFPI